MSAPDGAYTNPIFSQPIVDSNQPLLSPAARAMYGSDIPITRVDTVQASGEELLNAALHTNVDQTMTPTYTPASTNAAVHEHGSTGSGASLQQLCRTQSEQLQMLMSAMHTQITTAQQAAETSARQLAAAQAEMRWLRESAEASQIAQGEMMQIIQASQAREQQRHDKRTALAPDNVSAMDIAKIANACPHDGNTEKGMQWWAGIRGILQRACPEAVEIAESDRPPLSPAGPADKLLFDVVVACIDTNKAKGADLLLTIRQQSPSITDHGWKAKRIMCDEGSVRTTAEADAIYKQIAAEAVSLDTTKEQARTVAHKITAKWLRLPEDRRGHSRRNVELLLDAIPEVAIEVKRAIQALCDARESLTDAEPFTIDEMATHVYAHRPRARWHSRAASTTCAASPSSRTTRAMATSTRATSTTKTCRRTISESGCPSRNTASRAHTRST